MDFLQGDFLQGDSDMQQKEALLMVMVYVLW